MAVFFDEGEEGDNFKEDIHNFAGIELKLNTLPQTCTSSKSTM